MRRIQPHIPKAGKLAPQIQRLRSFGLSNPDFSQQIASKYSSFKLGRFPLLTLTLLQQARSPNYFNVLHQNLLGTGKSNVFNITQILKNEVINPLPSQIQLKFNLNFLCFWNRGILRLLGGENNARLPKLRPELLTFSQSNSILITRTSQLPTHSSRELKEQQQWLSPHVFLFQSPGNFPVIPLSVQPQGVGEYWRSQLVTRLFTKVREKGKDARKIQPKHNFDPKQGQSLSNLGNRFTDTSLSSNTQPIHDVVEHSVSKILRQSNQQTFSRLLGGENNDRLPKLRPELLTFSQSNSILITRTSQLPTHSSRKQKDQQQWLSLHVFLLQSQGDFPAIPLFVQPQKVGRDWRSQLVTRLFAKVRGKEKGSRDTKTKNNFYSKGNQGLSYLGKSFPNTFLNTKLGSEIELDRVDAGIEEYEEREIDRAKGKKNNLTLINTTFEHTPKTTFQQRVESKGLQALEEKFLRPSVFLNHELFPVSFPKNLFTLPITLSNLWQNQSISSDFSYEPLNLISRENNQAPEDLPQKNRKQVERSNFPTRLKQTQTPVLIHSRNMRRIISTFESKFNLVQQQRNIETTSILHARNKILKDNDELSLAPHHLRTKGINQQRSTLKEFSSPSEEFIFQRRVNNATVNNPSHQRDYAFSQTTAMEFPQSKAITTPISSRQESQIDRKNNWEKQRQASFDLANIDINRLADQVYQAIERKIRIERQRRGLV